MWEEEELLQRLEQAQWTLRELDIPHNVKHLIDEYSDPLQLVHDTLTSVSPEVFEQNLNNEWNNG